MALHEGSSDAYFYALNTSTGAVIWQVHTDGPIGSSAAIDSTGLLYFATDAGTLYQMTPDYTEAVFDPFG